MIYYYLVKWNYFINIIVTRKNQTLSFKCSKSWFRTIIKCHNLWINTIFNDLFMLKHRLLEFGLYAQANKNSKHNTVMIQDNERECTSLQL